MQVVWSILPRRREPPDAPPRDLCPDLWAEVIRRLPPDGLVRLGATCRSLRYACADDRYWQPHIDGRTAPPRGGQPGSSRAAWLRATAPSHYLAGPSTALSQPTDVGCRPPVTLVGDTLLVGHADGAAELWDVPSGHRRHTLRGHRQPVLAVALAPDTAVTGSSDRTARLWDAGSGELLYTLSGHGGFVSAVAIEGGTVLTGSGDHTVRLWDVASGEPRGVVRAASYTAVTSIALAGTMVLTADRVGRHTLWDMASGELRPRASPPGAGGPGVLVGGVVLTVLAENAAALCDARTGELRHRLDGHNGRVVAVALADGTALTGSRDGTAMLWDVASGQLRHTLRHTRHGYPAPVWSAALARDTALTGSADGTAKVWDVLTGQLRQVLRGASRSILFLAIAGDAAVTYPDCRPLELWHFRTLPRRSAAQRLARLRRRLLGAWQDAASDDDDTMPLVQRPPFATMARRAGARRRA